MRPVLAMTPAELAEVLGGEGRAKDVFALLREGKDPRHALPPGPRRRLIERTAPTVLEVVESLESADGTVKLRVRLADAREIETVLIPSPRRTTLCISSQVGCARACRFCSTGTMGLLRNLSPDEIAGQVALGHQLVRERALPSLSNVVLMGMGEPLDNFEHVKTALTIIVGSSGLGIGRRHLTLSTVGPTAQAVRKAGVLDVPLAWSLHAADDALRRRLIPTARTSVSALLEAFQEALAPRQAPLFVEVTLIDGVNDGPEQAEAIVTLFAGFPSEVRVNLLPMNSIGHAELGPARAERVRAFKDVLAQAGLRALVRQARGADQASACGQLVTRNG
jgi:23S rRNA (adenine2503-C2)-methyltransferase